MNEFYVRRVNQSTFDVFEGKQWGSWSRLKGNHFGVYVQKGIRQPHSVVKALTSMINPGLEAQFIILQ